MPQELAEKPFTPVLPPGELGNTKLGLGPFARVWWGGPLAINWAGSNRGAEPMLRHPIQPDANIQPSSDHAGSAIQAEMAPAVNDPIDQQVRDRPLKRW